MQYFKIPLILGFILSGWTVPAAFSSDACPPDFPKNLPCPQSSWETVDIEHGDRMIRLKRLSSSERGFSFFEDRISPREHGLFDFPASIPVLRVVAQQDVFFDSGSDKVRPEAYRLLDIIADSLKKEPPDVAMFVAGHTDADGDDDYNMKLGLARAHNVASALALRGIYQASIYRVSFGEHLPIAPNHDSASKARNRRVEFLFAARTEALVASVRKQRVSMCADQSLSMLNDCKQNVVFEAEKVFVSPKFDGNIIGIDKEIRNIAADKSKNSLERETARKELEVKRDMIPIENKSGKNLYRA